MVLSRRARLLTVLMLLAFAPAASAEEALQSAIRSMDEAWAELRDYRTQVVSTARQGKEAPEVTRLLYRFKKPNRIRIDFLSPHHGTTLIYPYDGGKVLVRPGGFLHFLKIPLDPGNSLLQVSPGQRIDQTDLGLLVRNIEHSVSDGRRGPVNISSTAEQVVIRVEAEDHFRKDVVADYTFAIDRHLWLPVEVTERVSAEHRIREVSFLDLEINVGLPDSLFRLP